MSTVGEYVEAQDPWAREVVTRLRALILEVPGVEEEFKWKRPVYRAGGPLCYLKVAKKHVSLGFDRGADLTDPDGLLEGSGKGMRHLKLASAEAIRPEQVRAWLAEARELNGG